MTDRLGRRTLAGGLLFAPMLLSTARAQTPPESTFDRVRRTKTLRIAVLPGELPYFQKDLASGEWSGACIEMGKDIAKIFDAKLDFTESTYGNTVLDLQSNKIDLGFALNPTPARALSISFTRPVLVLPFGCVARKGLAPTSWDDINKPDVRIVFDIGSLNEVAAKRYCAKASLTGYKTRDECTLALQSGRADVHILAAILGMAAVGKNPQLGAFHLLAQPTVALPSCIGIQREPDTRFVEVVNAWVDMNRGSGQIREWMLEALGKFGVTREMVPASLSF